jgi:glycerol-3-phosphate dehydrogenase
VRPLVSNGNRSRTARLSREHLIDVAQSGLITITGGKWTTYRAMAQDCIDLAARVGSLPQRPCVTTNLPILGGDDHSSIQRLIAADADDAEALDPALPETVGHVRWAARHEAARTVDDVLARRTRALHLNARAAIRSAPAVASVLADELGHDDAWQQRQVAQFHEIARPYLLDARDLELTPACRSE